MNQTESTLTLTVGGMTCDGCARSLENALKKQPGVTAVAVDLAQRTLRVTGTIELPALRRAVAAAGFEAEGA
mgnify:CR=1 FL=1